MSIERWFSASYAEARGKFIQAARHAGAKLTTYPHPEPGPNGELLAIDVARLGPTDAVKLLVTTSATHGVEGYCGSGSQVGLFETGFATEMPADMALLQVHAHNPHGFAHDRRVTEGNVDLNRNFVDFAHALPVNEEYDELHRLIVPAHWSGAARVVADMALAARAASGGMKLQTALTRGQYTRPDGLFFGGSEPTWSNRAIRVLAGEEIAGSRHVAVLDFHTGLGPRGVGELIVDGDEGEPDYRRARLWYGDEVKSPAKGESVSAVVQGTVDRPYRDAVGSDNCTFVTVEFGTLPVLAVLRALRADNWLYIHGEVASAMGRRIKREIRAAFYGEDLAWKEKVWTRAHEVARRTLAGLSSLGST